MSRLTLHLVRPAVFLVAALAVLSGCLVADPAPTDVAPPASFPRAQTFAYGPDARHLVDVYRPTSGTAKGVIVYVHGGAWMSGERSQVGVHDAVAHQLRDGWAVASISYRLAPESPMPAAVLDVRRAVRWLRANASLTKISTTRVVLSGHSAGAHIAMLAAVGDSRFEPANAPKASSRVDGVVAIAGPGALDSWRRHPLNFFGANAPQILNIALGWSPVASAPRTFAYDRARLVELSPQSYLDPSDPPAYLAYGGLDEIVPVAQGQQLYDAWSTLVGRDMAWLDVDERGAHWVESLNARALRDFLNQVASGTFAPS
jgi:acetyl esterase/lipase